MLEEVESGLALDINPEDGEDQKCGPLRQGYLSRWRGFATPSLPPAGKELSSTSFSGNCPIGRACSIARLPPSLAIND